MNADVSGANQAKAVEAVAAARPGARSPAPPPPPPEEPGPEAGGEQPGGGDEGGGHGSHRRFHLVVALSVALVSVLGAVVSWRVEVWGSAASELDQDAVAASITLGQQRAQAQTEADGAQSNFWRFQRLGQEAARLDPQGCSDPNPQTVTQLDAQAACSTQVVFSGYDDPAYIVRPQSAYPGYDTARYAADDEAQTRYFLDNDPAPYQGKAGADRHHEDLLLYLSLGLVLALGLLTLAQLDRRHRRALLLALPGWALLALGAVSLVALELLGAPSLVALEL